MITYFIIGLFVTSIDYILALVLMSQRYDALQFIVSVVLWPFALLVWLSDLYRHIKRGRA